MSRQRPGSSKNGLATGAISAVSGAAFLKALPRREAVPGLPLSVHSSARGRCSLCGTCCIDIWPLFPDPLSMALMQGPDSSVGRAQGA